MWGLSRSAPSSATPPRVPALLAGSSTGSSARTGSTHANSARPIPRDENPTRMTDSVEKVPSTRTAKISADRLFQHNRPKAAIRVGEATKLVNQSAACDADQRQSNSKIHDNEREAAPTPPAPHKKPPDPLLPGTDFGARGRIGQTVEPDKQRPGEPFADTGPAIERILAVGAAR